MVSVDFVQAQSFPACHAISTQFEVCFFHYHNCSHRSRPFFTLSCQVSFITMLGNVRLQVNLDRQIDHVPRSPCFPNLWDCVHYIRKGMFTKSDLQGIHVQVSNASYEIFFHSSIMTDTASAIVRQG